MDCFTYSSTHLLLSLERLVDVSPRTTTSYAQPNVNLSLQLSNCVADVTNSLMHQFCFSREQFIQAAHLAPFVILLLSLLFAVCSAYIYLPGPDVSPALVDLQRILIPTRSRWPAYYLRLLERTIVKSKTPTLALDLQTLVDDILSGTLEFRDATRDLPLLLAGNVPLSDLHVQLKISPWMHVRTALSLRLSNFCAGMVLINESKAISLLDPLRPARPSADTTIPTAASFCADLSRVAPAHLPDFLSLLHELLPSDTRILLLLATPEPALSSPALAAPAGLRTLDTSLPALLALLPSAGLSLEHVVDASSVYASALESGVRILEHDPEACVRLARTKGMRRWREERLKGAWEAALLRTGRLVRWGVTVCT
ncbi:hypothetical protein K488DRAFT_86073 [Vararia minispora EC-137]|uniref:Uncharacterized protein n=1 Tax=Vararia minispora EC-137 TaxID=1314806 RepID=A0ACB8QKH6_9AGAM|nr:hypothetical protein K488DRAFT_86073 [Vararia minispora EC-137]